MTKSQPQQEYIEIIEKLGGVLKTANIENTPEWMDYVFGEVIPEAERKLEAICSRPLVAHTSSTEAPEQKPRECCPACKLDWHDCRCDSSECMVEYVRNATLDDAIKAWEEWFDYGYERPIQKKSVSNMLQSLRKQGEP